MIKAVLTKPVEFTTFEGIKTSLTVDTLISIQEIPVAVVTTDLNGEARTFEGYVATHGNDTFDIERDEFKTVD